MTSMIFTVIIHGRVGPEVALALEGFDVHDLEGGRSSVTGSVADQAGLLSLLAVFDDLHFAVESVNPAGDQSPSGSDASARCHP